MMFLKKKERCIAPGLGAEIFRIVNLSNMYIETDVPENYIGSITKNKKWQFIFLYLAKQFIRKLDKWAILSIPTIARLKLKLQFPIQKETSNPILTAKLKLNDYTNSNAILIPQSIISENANGEQFIYIIKDKKDNQEAVAERLVLKLEKLKEILSKLLKTLLQEQKLLWKEREVSTTVRW